MALKALKAVRPLILSAIPLVLAASAFAQTGTRVDYPTQVRRKPITSGTTVPGSCVFDGDIFYNTVTSVLWTCGALTFHAPALPTGSLTLTGLTVNGSSTLNGLTTLNGNAYNSLSSLTDGAVLRGFNTLPNAANLAGGYFDFAPVLYNTDPLRPSTVCHDIYGNVVTQPIPLSGLAAFPEQDTLMWVGPSPTMPDRWNPFFEAGITSIGFTYYLGQIIEDQTTRHLQKVTTAGVSGTGPMPTFSTTGGTTADGSVVWTDQGLSNCGAPLLVNTVNGLNINSYFFALGGLGTMNPGYNAIEAFRGGITAQSYTGGAPYPAGTVVNAWVESVTLTPHAGGPLANAAYLGGYIQPGHSIGPPAAGTITMVTNPLTLGDGLAQGTIYWDDALLCLNIWSGTAWHCLAAYTGTPLFATVSTTGVVNGNSFQTNTSSFTVSAAGDVAAHKVTAGAGGFFSGASAGVTGATCTAWTQGLCTTP